MLAGMTIQQFDELYIASTIDPWEEDRADLRHAILCDTLCHANGMKKSTVRMHMKAIDWLAEPTTEAQREDTLKSKVAAIHIPGVTDGG